jgi:uncharacterized protein (DUF488 family)
MRKKAGGLCTIGYQGITIDEYLKRLRDAGVTLLCDVRGNPISRKPDFSKKRLAAAITDAGIRYEHLPELGIASKDRKGLKTREDYDALFKWYEKKILPKQTESLSKIATWINEGENVALTCFEAAPEECHRHCVAEALEKLLHGRYAIHNL